MLTKKTKTTQRQNTTRKIPLFEKLPKTRRSRILSMETYKINCGKNKLYGYKSLKAAEETSMHKDDFVHVVLSKLQDYDKPVVVKVYDANKLDLLLEQKIVNKIRDYRNTAQLICEFSCDDDKNNYITRLTKQIKFCERGTNKLLYAERPLGISTLRNADAFPKLYFFVYEYIAHGDISNYLQKTRDVKIIKTLILQVVCIIIELATIYKVCHGDLNSGNILIDTTDKKTLEYRICDEIVVIESNGIIPKIIDFGRSKFHTEPIILEHVWYDIIIVITLINTYVKNYDVSLDVFRNSYPKGRGARNKQDPYELDLPSINDYYYYVRDALYAPDL
jgi:serine/threonine protein kinase